MDFYSFLIPRPSYINNLPEMYFFFLPQNIIIYIVIFLLIILFLLRAEVKFIKFVFLGAWLGLSLLYLIQSGVQYYTERSLFGGKSLDELRELTTSNNFYSFLQFALKSVPDKEPVALLLPQNGDYFKQKAPYYIYPHKITNDASYILVFNTDNKEKFTDQDKVLSEYKPGMFVIRKK